MSWTTTYEDVPRDKERAFIIDYVQPHKVLDLAKVGGAWYVAVELVQMDKRTGEVACIVILTERHKGHLSYKGMREECGPGEDRCPLRILRLLSPTDNDYAKGWRRRCREGHRSRAQANKVRHGDVVVFASPLSFRGYGEWDRFTVHKEGRKVSFISPTGVHCRITRWRDREFQVA